VCERENESDGIYIYKDLWTFCDKMKCREEGTAELIWGGMFKKR
jgi:hypothetical protein